MSRKFYFIYFYKYILSIEMSEILFLIYKNLTELNNSNLTFLFYSKKTL